MKNRISKRVAAVSPSLTLAITAKAKELKAAGEPVISFGVGEPDFSTPEHIVLAAKEALDKGYTKYTPSSGMPTLKKAICDKFLKDNGLTYTPQQIIVSNGAKHSVFNACFALIEEGDEVIIPAPYWLTYPEAVRVCGGVPIILPCKAENDYKFTVEELRQVITNKTKLLIFNSPSNPTGAVYTEEETRKIAEVCVENGIFVLSDEIYEKLVYDGKKSFSIAACSPEMKDLTITINGVSKTYAMTGWRIGYLAAPQDVAKAIDSFQSHATSNACSISQYAAIEALSSPEEEVEKMVDVFAKRRKVIMEELKKIEGVSFVVPYGAFYVMLDVSACYGKMTKSGKKIQDSISFAEALLEEKKVAVVPGISFGADNCVRLSYSLALTEIVEGIKRIGEFIRSVL